MDVYERIKDLESLLGLAEPNIEDVRRLRQLVEDYDSAAVYFYEKNKNSEWLRPLSEAGELKRLEQSSEEVGIKGRSQAAYLFRMAGQKPEQVLEVVRSTKAKDPFIQRYFFRILLKCAESELDVADDAVGLVREYMGGREKEGALYVGMEAGQLMAKIVQEERDKAFEIAEVLLEVWKPPEEEKRRVVDIEARLKDFQYCDLIFKHYKKLWQLDALRATKQLTGILKRYCEDCGDDDYSVNTGFYIPFERLDAIDDRFKRDILAALTGGICDAGKVVIDRQPEKIADLLDFLWGRGYVIFERIVMYLLRFVPPGNEVERINSIISNRQFLEGGQQWYYEYRLLLRDKGAEISDEAKKVFLEWVEKEKIERDKELEEWFRKKEGRELTNKDVERISAVRRARQLYLVKDVFRQLFREYLEKGEVKAGDVAPRPMIGHARAVARTEGSPLTVDEMVKMRPGEAVEYLNDQSQWKINEERKSVFHTPEEGLSGVFEDVVAEKASGYISLTATQLAGLKPCFLAAYFEGIGKAYKNGKVDQDALTNVLEQAGLIVGEKGDDEQYVQAFRCLLRVIGTMLEHRGDEEAASGSRAETVWGLLEKLVRFPHNPKVIAGENTDPYTEFINSVQGKAFELILKLGLESKNEDEKSYQEKHSGRIREILSYVCGKVRDENIRCGFGVWLPQLHWMEREWVEANLDEILDEKDAKMWNAVWGSYVSWARPYPDLFKLAKKRGKYGHAVERLGITMKYAYAKNPEEGLMEHLLVALFNGWIELKDVLIQQFYEKAPAKLRGKAARFLSTGFEPIKKTDEKERNKVGTLAKKYWQMRLDAIRAAPQESEAEAAEFVRWAKDSPIEPGETFKLLSMTLEVTGGEVDVPSGAWDFVRGVCELGEGYELEALQCLNNAMVSKWMVTDFGLYEKSLTDFLERIIRLPDNYKNVEAIRREAMKLADEYGRRHIYRYKWVYEELSKKVGKEQK